jgi:hypothetical protein
MKHMMKFRDVLRESADILDELICLKDKEDSGEDITKETESILGRYMLKAMELQSLQQEM